MAVVKPAKFPRLSRLWVYAPLEDLDFDLNLADVSRVALMADWTAEPQAGDWHTGVIVADDQSSLWLADIGPALAILVGADQGDGTDTLELDAGVYLLWSDTKVPDSQVRLVDWHGPVELLGPPGGP